MVSFTQGLSIISVLQALVCLAAPKERPVVVQELRPNNSHQPSLGRYLLIVFLDAQFQVFSSLLISKSLFKNVILPVSGSFAGILFHTRYIFRAWRRAHGSVCVCVSVCVYRCRIPLNLKINICFQMQITSQKHKSL